MVAWGKNKDENTPSNEPTTIETNVEDYED
jgi:hypothetical protein